MSWSPRILSIQSHTVHGYVGNKAATFPLQLLGYNVDAINTISLSNHPAYPKACKGHSLAVNDFTSIIEGLEANSLLDYNAVLSGYCKSNDLLSAIESTVNHAKTSNPKLLYFLDPVLGDNGSFYVPRELADVYRAKLLPIASVITPNQFEAEILSGRKLDSLSDTIEVGRIFHESGVEIYIQKGLVLKDGEDGMLNVVASISSKNNLGAQSQPSVMYRKIFPRLGRNFSGCGDLFTALMTAWIAKYHDEMIVSRRFSIMGDILDSVVAVMSAVLQKTLDLESKELAIIESGDLLFEAKHSLSQSSKLDLSKGSLRAAGEEAHLMKGPVVGIIFDMDGTLTEPGAIDFNAMYARLGISRGSHDILAYIESIADPNQKADAYRIIEDEEDQGCERMKLRQGVIDCLSAIDSHKIRIAISTRNMRKSVNRFLDLLPEHMREIFSHMITRDCVNGINKPDPRVAWHILNQWGYLVDYDFSAVDDASIISSIATFGDVWFVGDSIDDIKCGRSAGCKTCIITTDYNKGIDPSLIDLRVDSIDEFRDVIDKIMSDL
jgi:pyridoxine kinase